MNNNTTNPNTLSRSAASSMAQVALFAALMAVLGLIPKIDLPMGVPITAQSLGVMLAGVLLGPKRGFQAMALFLLAVAAGLPLLSGGRGGIGVFVAPSAGYLLGYAPAALIAGLIMRAMPQRSPALIGLGAFVAALIGGLVALHAMGVAGLMLLAHMSLKQAVLTTLAFVPGDLIKCVLCAVITHTVARGLPDWQFGGRRA
ncbi:biotin transporter BioY [Diaphorobacter sp. HDW4A]|uniref:biotin transporter BioY n=1 Tax=Diaphorobacter sp. HDW4A TaxID=2714924 RepID=UPI001F0EF8EF|nr:biotin transporter BioY [Diaphorobacter sp. HDW4A]